MCHCLRDNPVYHVEHLARVDGLHKLVEIAVWLRKAGIDNSLDEVFNTSHVLISALSCETALSAYATPPLLGEAMYEVRGIRETGGGV